MSTHEFWTCPRCGNQYMSKDVRDFHAANDCAGEAEAVDVLGALWEAADDYEADMITDVARRAGLCWKCPDEACNWNNRADEARCGSCGKTANESRIAELRAADCHDPDPRGEGCDAVDLCPSCYGEAGEELAALETESAATAAGEAGTA